MTSATVRRQSSGRRRDGLVPFCALDQLGGELCCMAGVSAAITATCASRSANPRAIVAPSAVVPPVTKVTRQCCMSVIGCRDLPSTHSCAEAPSLEVCFDHPPRRRRTRPSHIPESHETSGHDSSDVQATAPPATVRRTTGAMGPRHRDSRDLDAIDADLPAMPAACFVRAACRRPDLENARQRSATARTAHRPRRSVAARASGISEGGQRVADRG